MFRHNSQLPEVQIKEVRVNYLAPRFLLGYLFLFCAFALTVVLIYQVQYAQKITAPGDLDSPNQGQVCIQVITPARNIISGEIKEFPTPCDVPDGWVIQAPGSPQQPNDNSQSVKY